MFDSILRSVASNPAALEQLIATAARSITPQSAANTLPLLEKIYATMVANGAPDDVQRSGRELLDGIQRWIVVAKEKVSA
jgi:hypothetical protein